MYDLFYVCINLLFIIYFDFRLTDITVRVGRFNSCITLGLPCLLKRDIRTMSVYIQTPETQEHKVAVLD